MGGPPISSASPKSANLRTCGPFRKCVNLWIFDLQTQSFLWFTDEKLQHVHKYILFLLTIIALIQIFTLKTFTTTTLTNVWDGIVQYFDGYSLKFAGFAICLLAHLKFFWIFDSGISPRICGFADYPCRLLVKFGDVFRWTRRQRLLGWTATASAPAPPSSTSGARSTATAGRKFLKYIFTGQNWNK